MAKKKTATKKVSRRDSARDVDRQDGFFNPYSGHGTDRDRRMHTSHSATPVTEQLAISMWRGDDIMARIVELGPREATRRGFTLKISGGKKGAKGKGKELAEQVMAECERLNLLEKIKIAGQYERAYGGAALFPVLEGAVGELHEPLDSYMDGIVKVSAIHVLEARELRPATWYTDITHPKFRQPETYRLWPLSGASGTAITGEVIHESRLAIFGGIRVSNQLQPGQRPGWGDSIVMRCHEVVSDFGLAWGSAATLLHEFATGVLKLDQLEDLLASKEGKKLVQEKVGLIEMMKSTINARVIGKNDDYTRQSTPVSGLEGLLVQLAQRLAAAADMPVTVLMGMSPAGLNATGDADIRGWYDRVETLRGYYRAIVEWLIGVVMRQTDGPTGGLEPDTWSMEWVPLWQPTEQEIATTRKIVMETDKGYFDMGAATAAKIAKSRWGGDTYSMDMHFDEGELDGLVEQTALNGNPEDLDDEELAAMGVDVEAYRAVQAQKAAAANGNAPPADGAPAEGGIPAPPPDGAVAPTPVVEAIQSTVLNGAQVSSLVAVITAVVNKEIPRQSAQKIIELAYQVSPEIAIGLLGPEDFEKPAPAVPPAFGGKPGVPPGAPAPDADGAPPGDEKTPPAKDDEPVEGEEPPPPKKGKKAKAKKPEPEPAEAEPDEDEDEK